MLKLIELPPYSRYSYNIAQSENKDIMYLKMGLRSYFKGKPGRKISTNIHEHRVCNISITATPFVI